MREYVNGSVKWIFSTGNSILKEDLFNLFSRACHCVDFVLLEEWYSSIRMSLDGGCLVTVLGNNYSQDAIYTSLVMTLVTRTILKPPGRNTFDKEFLPFYSFRRVVQHSDLNHFQPPTHLSPLCVFLEIFICYFQWNSQIFAVS